MRPATCISFLLHAVWCQCRTHVRETEFVWLYDVMNETRFKDAVNVDKRRSSFSLLFLIIMFWIIVINLVCWRAIPFLYVDSHRYRTGTGIYLHASNCIFVSFYQSQSPKYRAKDTARYHGFVVLVFWLFRYYECYKVFVVVFCNFIYPAFWGIACFHSQ